MLNKDEARIFAIIEIGKFFGVDYVKEHLEGCCEAYPEDGYDDKDFDYFLGFEGNQQTNLWTVFARVSVNCETQEVTFLDYKKPNGERMENPVRPVRCA